MMFKVGDKVMLKDGKYSPSDDNPTDTVGTVVQVMHSLSDSHPIEVIWANNEHNVYNPSDLYPAHNLGRLLAGVEDAEITE